MMDMECRGYRLTAPLFIRPFRLTAPLFIRLMDAPPHFRTTPLDSPPHFRTAPLDSPPHFKTAPLDSPPHFRTINITDNGSGRGRCVQFNWSRADGGECGLGRRGGIPYWGCKSNLCGAVWKGASNLTGAYRGRMWIGANVDWGGAR